MDRKKFSSLLIRLRKESNLTQQDFAEIFNVSYQAVSKWENGESLPDIVTLENLSRYYNVSINDLLNGNYNPQATTITENVTKENAIQETITKENTTNENANKENNVEKENIEYQTFSLALAKKNIFKIIWCSASIILFLLLSILPVFDIDYFSFNFYSICFSSNFLFGNFIMLTVFLLFITKNILGIISVFTKNNKVLLLLEEAFSIYCFIALFDILCSNLRNASVGLYLLAIQLAASWITHVFCKKLNFNSNLNNHLQLQLDRAALLISCLFVFFIILCMRASNQSEKIILALIYLALMVADIIFYIILYFKPRNKKYTILYYVFFYLSLVFHFVISIFEIFPISVTLITIITIAFEIVRYFRDKKARLIEEKK